MALLQQRRRLSDEDLIDKAACRRHFCARLLQPQRMFRPPHTTSDCRIAQTLQEGSPNTPAQKLASVPCGVLMSGDARVPWHLREKLLG